jgi:hypothetical protein
MKPSDFHPVVPIKELLDDKRFVTAANVKQAVASWLQFYNLGYKPWHHGGTRTYMPLLITWIFNAYHLLSVFSSRMEVRKMSSASESLMLHFLNFSLLLIVC